MRYHLTLIRMAVIKKSTNNKCWRGSREKDICTVKRGESATAKVQLVKIWIVLQSFSMGQKNISTKLVFGGNKENPE